MEDKSENKPTRMDSEITTEPTGEICCFLIGRQGLALFFLKTGSVSRLVGNFEIGLCLSRDKKSTGNFILGPLYIFLLYNW